MFKKELTHASNQGRATLLQVLDSDFGFKGCGAVFKGEALEICAQAEAGPGKPRLNALTRLEYLRDNPELIARFLAIVYRLICDMGFQDEWFDITVANVWKKAVWPCNFLVAHQQPGFIQIGKPANAKRDQKLKAYVHGTLLDNEEWKRGDFKEEFGLAETGKKLERSMFTPNVIGSSVHGFSSNGAQGDQSWYEKQSARGPSQVKASEGERKRVHGWNADRIRDIEEGYYGILEAKRDKGRMIYEYIMKEVLGLESHILAAKRPCDDKNTKEEQDAKKKRKREQDKLRKKGALT